MEDIVINGKALYTPKGAALEYGRVGCNFYTGCPHNCEYCYLKRGAPSKQLGGTEVKLKKCFKDKDDALEIFCKEAEEHRDYLRKKGLFLSFTTDPLIPETISLTISVLNFCIYNNIHVKVLTKDANFIDYDRMRLFMKSDAAKEFVHFGFTLTGRNDMEPNASTNEKRIATMRKLHEDGFKTWASIEPVIDWESSRKVIEASLDCCDHYKIGLRSGVGKDYYNLEQSANTIVDLVYMITDSGHTVYLKNSARKLLEKVFNPKYREYVHGKTVDMDGNPM